MLFCAQSSFVRYCAHAINPNSSGLSLSLPLTIALYLPRSLPLTLPAFRSATTQPEHDLAECASRFRKHNVHSAQFKSRPSTLLIVEISRSHENSNQRKCQFVYTRLQVPMEQKSWQRLPRLTSAICVGHVQLTGNSRRTMPSSQ